MKKEDKPVGALLVVGVVAVTILVMWFTVFFTFLYRG